MRNKASIALAIALVLVTVYQQGQLKQLRNEYKILNSQNLDFINRLHDLEAQNEQTQKLLEQINARVGYMDSKVTNAIDTRPPEREPMMPVRDEDDTPPSEGREKPGTGILDGLRELFN